ncbi:MAG: relaxase/mobilization nuclease domain-containing protein [Hyphomonadaceae bacterium]
MIVVINPSGSAGHSFKGLHAYCAHDAGSSSSAERVEWMATRNLASDDPDHAWRIMAATALAQNALKAAAGVPATGRKSSAHVMHIVLSFHEKEGRSPEEMQAAADELLSQLGATGGRGKKAPIRIQRASEHQAVYYAHSDTDSRHLHIMLNRVHGEHGVLLPSSNDQLKASRWAQAYSEKYGTEHATPDRQINNEARDKGEYVKGKRRSLKRAFEETRAAKAANDNDIVEAVLAAQAKKDAALALQGRNMKAMHVHAWKQLAAEHKSRREAVASGAKRALNKARADIRDSFRPRWSDLDRTLKAEQATFVALETSFFGRAKNIVSTLSKSRGVKDEQAKGLLSQGFRVIVSASERRALFEKTQTAKRRALQREQDARMKEAAEAAKKDQAKKLEDNRAHFLKERDQLKARQDAQRSAHGADWRKRNAERSAALEQAQVKAERRDDFLASYRKAAKGGDDDPHLAYLAKLMNARGAFDRARDGGSDPRDVERDREIDRDRD